MAQTVVLFYHPNLLPSGVRGMADENKRRQCTSPLIICAQLALGFSAVAVVLPLYIGSRFLRAIVPSTGQRSKEGPQPAPGAEVAAPQEGEYLAPGVWRCPDVPPVDALVGGAEGTKYHRPSCRWAQNIQDGNRICFSSGEAAQAYGYSPCGTCRPA